MKNFQNKAAASALIHIYTLLLVVVSFSALYIGQAILIPLTLGILLTFLLSPLVSLFERYIGRISAVLVVVFLIFSGLGIAGYILTHEFVDLMTKLPTYKNNIEAKINSFQIPQNGVISKVVNSVENLKHDLPAIKGLQTLNSGAGLAPSQSTNKIPITVVDSSSSLTQAAQFFLGILLNFMFMLGLVMLLVIFMLLNRENLKGRVISLIGKGNIGPTTRAMEEAGARVSKYIWMQLIINIGYGLLIAIGLYFIGIPNAGLWGGLLIVLRFIPYVGTWIAASIPVMLSFLISTSWYAPLLTIGLYTILDLIISNFVEPWMYGLSVGVSSMGLIIAAVFWTLLWGPMGLVLATPLTVCLVVMGQHVSRLKIFSILLSDEQPLSTSEECYHLLLREDVDAAMKVIDNFLKENSILDLYDTVFLSLINKIEIDFKHEAIDNDEKESLYGNMQEMIEELGNRNQDEEILNNPPAPVNIKVLCIPIHPERDEMIVHMLMQLLQNKVSVESTSSAIAMGHIIESINKTVPDYVLISATFPASFLHVTYLSKKLYNQFPNIKIIIGLWGRLENQEEIVKKLKHAGAFDVVFSLKEIETKLDAFNHIP